MSRSPWRSRTRRRTRTSSRRCRHLRHLRVALALADPTAHAHLFPEMPASTQAAAVLGAQRAKSLGKASAYPSIKELVAMNANEEIKTNGEAAFAELIKNV